MEKRKLNHHKGRHLEQVKKVDTLEPKGKEPDYVGYRNNIMSKLSVSGL